MDARAKNRVKKNEEEFLRKERTKQWISLPGMSGRVKDTTQNRRKIREIMKKKEEIENLLAEFRVNQDKTSKTASEYFKLLSIKRKEMEEIWKSIERE